MDLADQSPYVRLIEDDDGVDVGQCGYDFGAFIRGHKRTSVAFDLPDAGIGVEGDNQLSAQRFGAAEIAHVSDVQQVETAVGQDDLLTVAPPLGDLCL